MFRGVFFLAALAEAKRVVMEGQAITSLVEDWVDMGAANPTQLLEIGVSLKTDPIKRAELEAFFWSVSDPTNALYGQYKTHEEVKAWLAADERVLSRVTAWLGNANATSLTLAENHDTVHAILPVAALEALLDTTFHTFTSLKYGVKNVPRIVAPYSLPEEVADYVALVDGVRTLPGLRVAGATDSSGVAPSAVAAWPNYCPGSKVCTGKITPNITAQIYGTLPLTQNFKVADGNAMGIAEFQGQHYDLKDLVAFGAGCGVPTVVVNDVNGLGVGATGGVETMLDIEYISGNGLGIPLYNYYYVDYSLIKWITQVNAQTARGVPSVYSVSYGNDEVQQTSKDYMFQCNTQFMAAAAKGYSVLFASGDQGVWGRTGRALVFHPDFPASSPYITAVGGTDFTQTAPNVGPGEHEEACSADGGGGFSNTFDMPDYQVAAVKNYVSVAGATLPPQAYWNATGRAYPDIAANFGAKVPYCILANGAWEGVGGTSASSPTVAHGIAVLNNIQLAASKPVLGFLNPWLYQTLAAHADAFTDIISGKNNQGAGEGFTAAAGWDPCSGVGTPNFDKMAQYLP